MRPTTRHQAHAHRPKRRAPGAGWRTSKPRHITYATDCERRPGLIACLSLVSGYGRGLRMVAGGLLIALGASAGGGFITTSLASFGLAAMLEPMFDLCLAAPLLGFPVDGDAIRAMARERSHAR